MKTIDELIQESIEEIETESKPIKQVLTELTSIIESRNNYHAEKLEKQRLAEIRTLIANLNKVRTDLVTIIDNKDDMSINLIGNFLYGINEYISHCIH